MRNTAKYPNNSNTITIYLPNHVIKELDRISEMTGLSRGKVLTQMASECLPKAKMAERKVYTVSFD